MKGDGLIGNQTSDKKSQFKSIVVNMSAKVGSIGDNGMLNFLNCTKCNLFIYTVQSPKMNMLNLNNWLK